MARQPEPDLEFTEEELDQTMPTRPSSPMNPRKKSGGGRSILWVLLVALVGGIAYLAMEPEMLNEWLRPYLGETPPPTHPPVAMKPRPVPPAPSAPAPESVPVPSDVAPTPPAPVASAPTPTTPAPPVSAPVPAAPTRPNPAPIEAAPKPAAAILSPMFAEGQKVTVMADQTAPGQTIALSIDATGSTPGPVIRPGSTLTVLDGDLQPTGWMYQVRGDEGTKGWVTERRLRLKF